MIYIIQLPLRRHAAATPSRRRKTPAQRGPGRLADCPLYVLSVGGRLEIPTPSQTCLQRPYSRAASVALDSLGLARRAWVARRLQVYSPPAYHLRLSTVSPSVCLSTGSSQPARAYVLASAFWALSVVTSPSAPASTPPPAGPD